VLRSSTVSFPEERSVTFTIFFSVPTAKFRDSILKYATDASFQILSNSHFIIVILFYSERYVTNAVDIASLKCWGEKERERERWSIPSMLCDRHAQQRLHSSAACVQLPQWPHPLPGTSKPSFKVSYNNSIHSIPLRNTIPPPPSDPSIGDLSLLFHLQQHFLFHPTTPPYSLASPLSYISFLPLIDILFTSGRPLGGRQLVKRAGQWRTPVEVTRAEQSGGG
jgi:hypothetical protein